MFSNFCGIKIQGKCFQSEVKLNFFEKEYHRFCLIYGKNGSGKSTISQAFDTVEQNNQSLIASQIIDKSGAAVDLTNEDQKKNIFVFNEEYVNSKVKIKNNGLDAIVLLGKAKDIDEKLEKAKRINEKLKGRQSKYQEDFQKYSDIQNTDNPEKYKYDIIKSLKDNFAEREKNILGNTNRNLQNKTIEFAKNIIDHFETDVSTDELKNNFDEKLKSYEDMQSDLNFSEDIKKLNFEDIKQLLLHRVEQKQLSPREGEIKQIIQSDQITKNIMEGDSNICPYCVQKLTDE